MNCSPNELLTKWTAHQMNCSPNELLTKWTAHQTNCSPNELLTKWTAHQMNCSPNELLTKWTAHQMNCSPKELLTKWTAHQMNCSPNIFRVIKSRKIEWVLACGTYRRQKCTQGVGGETWRKKTLGIPRNRWEDKIKLYLKLVGYGMDWIDLALDRDRLLFLVNAGSN